MASELLRWWRSLEEADELSDVEGFAKYRGDTVADFYEAVGANTQERGWFTDGEFTILSLARWCRMTIEGFGHGDFVSVEDLAEYMRLEFVMVSEQHTRVTSMGGMEDDSQGQDVDTERRALAEDIVGGTTGKVNFGWHSISEEPSGVREVGPFEKRHPLEFPMGIGGLYDDLRSEERRPSARVWAQHLLRLWGGWCVHGLRGHRLVWAIVNTVLLQETRGKGFAAQKAARKRLGYP